MRILKIIEFFLLHIAADCSIACIIFKILDWYNPFMDFQENGIIFQWVLYISTIVLALLTNLKVGGKDICSRRKRNSHS